MKKNVLKILLALCIVAMVFALVACGGGDSTTPTTNKKDTKTDDKKTEDTVDAVQALSNSLNKVVQGADGYLSTVQSIKEDSSIGVDVALGGYYVNSGESASKGNFKLGLQGNAKKADPDLKLAFTLNKNSDTATGDEYVAIGYKQGKLYFKQPLNLINTTATAADGVEMDITSLQAGINNIAAFAMKNLAEVVADEKFQQFSLDGVVGGILNGEDGQPNEMVGLIAGFINAKEESNKYTLSITGENIVEIVNLLPTFIDNWSDITKTVDTVLKYAYDYANLEVNGNSIYFNDGTKEGGQALTFSTIINFAPSIEIIAGTDSNNTLNSIKIGLNFSRLNIAFGLALDVNTFKVGSSVNVGFSGYSAKNLQAETYVSLGVKDKIAKVTAVANTATAFKANSNDNFASATFELNSLTAPTNANKVVASYDGQKVYINFADYGEVSAEDKGFIWDSGFNVKTELAAALMKVGQPSQNNGDGDGDVVIDDDDDDYESLDEFPIDFSLDPLSVTIEGKALMTFLKENCSKYVTFTIVDSNNDLVKDAQATFANITAVYETAENILKNSYKLTDNVAGVYLLGNNGNNLVAFAAKFVKIPTITEDGKFDTEHVTNEITNDLITDYIEAVFALDDEDAATSYANWDADIKRIFAIGDEGFSPAIVEIVLGVPYDEIAEDGIFAYAKYNKNQGLSGAIGLNMDEQHDSQNYFEIGASIGFVAAATVGQVIPAEADAQIVVDDAMNEDIFDAIIDSLEYAFVEPK